MSKVLTKVNCPHCQGTKVVKNGRKKDGTQNFLCKSCGKQFQQAYRYKGADPKIKHLIVSMLLRNSGIRDIATVLQVSRACVLNQLLKQSEKCVITPKQKHYKSVQIDEFWSYVQHKKKHKRWLFYAYAPETNEVLGYVIGNRSAKTIKKLLQMLKDIEIDQYCTEAKVFLKAK
ncbi:IS1 family transposase [Raineya sp.]